MRIEVRGQPAPQGSKRPVRLGNGKIGMAEASKAVGPWREAVRAETQRTMNGAAPLGSPVQVTLTFGVLRAKSHFRTGRYAGQLKPGAAAWPASQPDLDKLARAVLDGLTAGGAWKDDAQVVTLIARKVYAAHAGCVIIVDELEGW